jgi:catalase
MRSETFADHYSQATLFWQSQTAPEQQHIVEALQFELGKLTVPAVRVRMLSNLVNVEPALAGRVAAALGVAVPAASPRTGNKRYAPSPALSMVSRANPKSIVGRQVAVLAADGVDASGLQAIKAELVKGGATVRIVSTRLGDLQASGGGMVKVDDMFLTTPSVVFDAVLVAGGAASAAALKGSGDAVLFVREAFKHAKAIAALGEGIEVLATAGIANAGPGVATGDAGGPLAGRFIADIAAHRHWSRTGKEAVAA